MRPYILLYWVGGIVGVLVAIFISGLLGANLGFSILMTAVAGCGVHCLMKTVIDEKVKLTQPFIMSLPITITEFSTAKLALNLIVFSTIWLPACTVCFVMGFGEDRLPPGSIPVMSFVLVGIFLAYTTALCVCVVTQTYGYAILAIIIGNFITVFYLWGIVYWEPIGTYVWGTEVVWNSTAISIIAAQVLAIISLLPTTVFIQSRKTDFI